MLQNIFRAVLLTDSLVDAQRALKKLAQILDLSDGNVEELYEVFTSSQPKKLTPFILKQQLSWKEVPILEAHCSDLPGVSVEVGQARHYPLGSAAAHVDIGQANNFGVM